MYARPVPPPRLQIGQASLVPSLSLQAAPHPSRLKPELRTSPRELAIGRCLRTVLLLLLLQMKGTPMVCSCTSVHSYSVCADLGGTVQERNRAVSGQLHSFVMPRLGLCLRIRWRSVLWRLRSEVVGPYRLGF